MKTVRFGIIGCGAIGSIHLERLRKINSAKVVAACDINSSVLEKFGTAAGLEKQQLFTDYKKMLKIKDLDVVIVGIPNRLHAPVTVEALESGKNVFCEKPVSVDYTGAKSMFDAAKKNDKKLQIGLMSRFRSDSQIFKRLIENGELGEVYYAKCSATRRSGIPGWGSWFTREKDAGAGPIYDIGVHTLDITMWLMSNSKPSMAYASKYSKFGPDKQGMGTWGTPEPNGYFDVEDLASAFLRMENGASIFLEVSWASHINKGVFNQWLLGTKAGLDFEASTIYSTEMGNPVDKKITVEANDAYLAEMQSYIKCILNDEEPLTRPEEMLGLQKALDMILRSASENRAVRANEI